jgi:hypothetical protein
MYHLSFIIEKCPEPQNKKNKRHWGARNAEAQEWAVLVQAALMWNNSEVKFTHKPIEPLRKAQITIVRHSERMLDYDGLVGSMKPVVDALVKNGILADDSWPITGPWIVNQKFRAKKLGQLTQVIVEEIHGE